MRILQVTREVRSDRRYGLGKSLQPIVNELELLGYTTRYLTKDDLGESQRARFQLIERTVNRLLFASIKGVVLALIERIQMGIFATSLATKEGYTHIHVHDPWIGVGVLLGTCLKKQRGIKWGLTEHGFGAYANATLEDGLFQSEYVHKSLRRLERWVLRQADWVIVPTSLAAHALARDLCLIEVPAHWHVVTHSLPFDGNKTHPALRSSLGWKYDDFVVLAVGRIVPLKRFELLIRVCASLYKTYPKIRVLILGEGEADGLLKMAEMLGFSERVSISCAEDIRNYYSAADIYVSASSSESFGLANLEALCAGLPCVFSSVGGVSEVVGSGGWLIDCNYENLLKAISELIKSDTLRSFWKKQAIDRTSDWPSVAEVTSKYVSIYR